LINKLNLWAMASIKNLPKILVMVGNSRIHWAYYYGGQCLGIVHSGHRDRGVTVAGVEELFQQAQELKVKPQFEGSIPLVFASVVPSQNQYFATYPAAIHLQLQDVPLKNTYPTLGIDRALAVVGAGDRYGLPCLVIDGGTALTYTGVNGKGELVGGAIAVGIRQQLLTLSQSTANLPLVTLNPGEPRWPTNTEDAIAVGVLSHTLAGISFLIEQWLTQFPASALVVTGGDGPLIYEQLRDRYDLISDRDCIFDGMNRSLNDKNHFIDLST
jgi:type III pantothenate kinase